MKKHLTISILGLLATLTLQAEVEYENKIVCKEGVCEKREVFSNLKSPDLKIEDLRIGKCLLDLPKSRFYRIEDLDLPSKKLVILSEINENKISVEMQRDTIYTDSRDFNLKLKIIDCDKISGYIINNEPRYLKCLQGNSARTRKLWCEKERIKNF